MRRRSFDEAYAKMQGTIMDYTARNGGMFLSVLMVYLNINFGVKNREKAIKCIKIDRRLTVLENIITGKREATFEEIIKLYETNKTIIPQYWIPTIEQHIVNKSMPDLQKVYVAIKKELQKLYFWRYEYE